MNKKVFYDKLIELKLFYPNWSIDLSNKDVVKKMYEFLGNTSDDRFTSGVENYIRNEIRFPTIAGLIEYIDHDLKNINKNENLIIDSGPPTWIIEKQKELKMIDTTK